MPFVSHNLRVAAGAFSDAEVKVKPEQNESNSLTARHTLFRKK